jgi:hypothetical protein
VVKKKIAEVQGNLGVAVATDVEPAKKWCEGHHTLHLRLSTRFAVLPDLNLSVSPPPPCVGTTPRNTIKNTSPSRAAAVGAPSSVFRPARRQRAFAEDVETAASAHAGSVRRDP